MATDSATIVAIPYAKAAFEIAVAEQQLSEWENALALLTAICKDEQVERLLKNPLVSSEELAQFLISLLDKSAPESVTNLLKVLAQSKRLAIIPDLFLLFRTHRAEYEKTMDVDVRSYFPLSENQSSAIKQALEKRLSRRVSINNTIDKDLLGGAVINAGDLVIDGSVRGKLNKLANEVIA